MQKIMPPAKNRNGSKDLTTADSKLGNGGTDAGSDSFSPKDKPSDIDRQEAERADREGQADDAEQWKTRRRQRRNREDKIDAVAPTLTISKLGFKRLRPSLGRKLFDQDSQPAKTAESATLDSIIPTSHGLNPETEKDMASAVCPRRVRQARKGRICRAFVLARQELQTLSHTADVFLLCYRANEKYRDGEFDRSQSSRLRQRSGARKDRRRMVCWNFREQQEENKSSTKQKKTRNAITKANAEKVRAAISEQIKPFNKKERAEGRLKSKRNKTQVEFRGDRSKA